MLKSTDCELYMKCYRYEVDETNPEETMAEMMFEEDGYTYQILSKPVIQKKKPPSNSDDNSTQATSTTVN